MIFRKPKLYAIGGAAIIVAGVLAGSAWYVKQLHTELAQEKSNNQILQNSIEVQQDTIKSMQQDFRDIRQAQSNLAAEHARQREESQALLERFNTTATGEPRDFESLASQRPDSVERLINRGTSNAMRCIELASGAEHTHQELSAILSSQINPECPSLANPNYRPLIP